MKCKAYKIVVGIEVNQAAEIGGILPGPATLKCLILLWTGDYPAQSEIAKTISHGIRPCRRCELEGIITHNALQKGCAFC